MSADGGPAFPMAEGDWSGMSLRDWFAGQALAGMLSAFAKQASKGGPARFAEANCDTAYDIADAMLRARERGQEADGDEAWFAKQPNACVSVADDVVMASSGRHYLASGSTRAAAIRALRAKVEGGAR